MTHIREPQHLNSPQKNSHRGTVLKGRGFSHANTHAQLIAALAAEGMRKAAKAFPRGLKPDHFIGSLLARLKPRPFKATRIAILALVCTAAIGAFAQSPTYRIVGTVINATTGAPVQGATVAVLAVEDSHRIAAVHSANDGRFAVDGLPEGKYQLTASKRGFTTAAYDEHEQFSSAIVTGEAQDTTNLIFRLTPGAVLRGVVTADGGDPVEGARVMLFTRPQTHDPGAKIQQADASITDDTGAYEFDNLPKGNYLLAVAAEPWYALHSGGSRQAPHNPSLDVAYPITFFDSTTEEASASPLLLTGGSRVEADINLHAVPAVRLTVEAPRKPDGSSVPPQLRQTVFGAEVSVEGSLLMGVDRTERAVLEGLAPGQYELTQGDPPRVVVLDAITSQQIDPGTGIPAFALSGTLQTATGAPFTGEAVVTLEPADASQGLKPMVSEFNRGSFSFAAVPAGKWSLAAEQSGLPVPVISVALGACAHAGNLVTVQDRPLTIVVRVSADGMNVEGFARKKGKGVSGVMVLLIPKDPSAFPAMVRRDQSDSDGSFAVRDVSRGDYTVVAIENAWGDGNALDWVRREVIARYLPGGVPVTVRDAPDKVIHLSAPVPVQKR
jgi:5-hydroxyisourate hydrolase-like protein (transthyretin family)